MYQRYAVYFLPDDVWGEAGARWLGWDCRTSQTRPASDDAQHDLTNRPRKYGFHATIKAPFRLAEMTSEDDVLSSLTGVCKTLSSIGLHSLQIAQIGRFFAFTSPEERADLIALARLVVIALDPHRAPLTESELARRRTARLSPEQDALLQQWGYPHVMERYQFHMTLTGPVKSAIHPRERLNAAFSNARQVPLYLDSLSLAGEREDGRFEQIARIPLSG